MSIEQNLADLTAAVNNLTAVISSKIGPGVVSQTVSKAETNGAKKETSSPKSEKAEGALSAPPADTPDTQATTVATSGALDYDKDVKPAFLKLVQTKGRAAGRKIIDAFAPTKEKLSEAITTQEQFGQALELIAKEMK